VTTNVTAMSVTFLHETNHQCCHTLSAKITRFTKKIH